MSFSERLEQIKTGFERPFWVANVTELFERLSYYAAFASLARYLHEALMFPVQKASGLAGLFRRAGLVPGRFRWDCCRPAGLSPRAFAGLSHPEHFVFSAGITGRTVAGARARSHAARLAGGIVLALPALGIALVKPSVVGTTARASNENVRSIGYSIYYTLVNIGGAAGPYVASWVHRNMSVENVFRVAAGSVFVMFFAVLIFFREPRRSGDVQTASLGQSPQKL